MGARNSRTRGPAKTAARKAKAKTHRAAKPKAVRTKPEAARATAKAPALFKKIEEPYKKHNNLPL